MFSVLWFEDLAAPIPIGSFKTADRQPLKAPYGRIWPHMGTLGALGGSLGSLGGSGESLEAPWGSLGEPLGALGGSLGGPWGSRGEGVFGMPP